MNNANNMNNEHFDNIFGDHTFDNISYHVKTEISKINELIILIKESVEKEYKNVLVILDLDDTLISPVVTLGSDAWFKYSLTDRSENINDVLNKIYHIYPFLKYQPVEQDTKKLLELITEYVSNNKIKFFLLTSRNTRLYSYTIKHLEDAGFLNIVTRENMLCVDNFLNIKISETININNIDNNFYSNDKDKYFIRYIDNICLASGNNKGNIITKIIKDHYKNMNDRFDLIIFVDDSLSNIMNTQKYFENDNIYNNINTYNIHYKYKEESKTNYSLGEFINDNSKIENILKLKEIINDSNNIDV